jgi:hypothetical protein
VKENLKRKIRKPLELKKIQCLGHVFKLAASFKDKPKENAKQYIFKDPKNQKNRETKKVWVIKEKSGR